MEYNEDVTTALLAEHKFVSDMLARNARRTRAPKFLSSYLIKTLEILQAPDFDSTLENIRLPLLYSRMFSHMLPRDHLNVIRLIKGRFLLVLKHQGNKPFGSRAADDIHSTCWYEIKMNLAKFPVD